MSALPLLRLAHNVVEGNEQKGNVEWKKWGIGKHQIIRGDVPWKRIPQAPEAVFQGLNLRQNPRVGFLEA